MRFPAPLQQNDALTRNLDPLPALHAAHNVIQTDHVIAGLREAHAVLFIRAARQRRFLGPADPSNLVIRKVLAHRTTQRLGLRFRLLGKKLPFVHRYSPFAAIPGIVIRMGSRISLKRSADRIFFSRAISRTVLPVLYDSFAIAAASS